MICKICRSSALDNTIEKESQSEMETSIQHKIQDVKGFDVIEFPNVGRQDSAAMLDTTTCLDTLTQMVIFVVNYKYVHTCMYIHRSTALLNAI